MNNSRASTNIKVSSDGGDINISNGLSGGLNGSKSFSETINYKQESYRTTIDRKTNHKSIGWGVEAHKIMNNGWGPYGRDSYDPTYGNELFLGGRKVVQMLDKISCANTSNAFIGAW